MTCVWRWLPRSLPTFLTACSDIILRLHFSYSRLELRNGVIAACYALL